MNNIIINKNADQWELFTHMSGAEEVAKKLNKKITKLINNPTLAPQPVFDEMEKYMRNYSDIGAMDTEPRWVVIHLIRKYLDKNFIDK